MAGFFEEQKKWLDALKAGDEVVVRSTRYSDKIGIVSGRTEKTRRINLTNGDTYNSEGTQIGVSDRHTTRLYAYTEEYKQRRALEQKANVLYNCLYNIKDYELRKLSLDQLEKIEVALEEAGLIKHE